MVDLFWRRLPRAACPGFCIRDRRIRGRSGCF
jgi:hypothetical protein